MKNLFELKAWDELSVDQAIDLDMRIFRAIKCYDLARLYQGGVEAIVERLNLEVFLEHFNSLNRSLRIPYHNKYHAYCMVLNCYEGAYYEKLSIESTRALVAAALLHDANHSGGHLSDEQNIQNAVEFAEIAQYFAGARFMALSPKEFTECIDCIKITKYPYESVPATPAQKIIRDADLMQPYEDDSDLLLKQYLGLKEEIELSKGPLTKKAFAEGMYDFLNNVEWQTDWAILKAETRGWDVLKLNLKHILEKS